MKNSVRILTVWMILSLGIGCAGPRATPTAMREPDYWPTDSWRSSSPEAQGMDPERLVRMFEYIEEKDLNLHSLLLVRNGYLVTEAYFDPYTRDTAHFAACITKSVVGILTGIAIEQGYIKSIDEPVLGFFPNRPIANMDARKQSMQLKHLLSLTPGLSCKDMLGSDAAMQKSKDWIQYTLDLPMISEPGAHFTYCSPAVHLLSAIIQRQTGLSAREFANEQLFMPLGIAPVPAERWPSDPNGISMGYGLQLLPRDMAKLGHLYLNRGKWHNRQIVSPDWVAASTTRHSTWEEEAKRDYGYLFWLFSGDGYYSAMGLGGQQIHTAPDKNMVVVVTAGLSPRAEDYIRELMRDYILPAARSNSALPANPRAAEQLAWAVRRAGGLPRPVPALPEVARQVSGRTYKLEHNPFGWQTFSFSFSDDKVTASFTVNGSGELAVGLDDQFRITELPGPSRLALKGYWERGDAFVIEATYLDVPSWSTLKATFAGSEINATLQDTIFGGPPVYLRGTSQD